ncbi:MAG TPA: hypothetical protein PKD05_08490 [Candidatus Melainabacteria bacterium]|nr:hypothetical protein [Candidatus Melainabacteria bacterium]HMP51580.1 hypothetical protein [Candidatus Melainabacteria bacterium]
MSSFVNRVTGIEGNSINCNSSLNNLLETILYWREGKLLLDETEQITVKLWILQKACRLAIGEEVTVVSESREDLFVSVGRISAEKVSLNDSEDVLEARICDLILL